MNEYQISPVPNQSFNLSLAGNDYEIQLRSFRGIIYASLFYGGAVVSAGNKVTSNVSIFTKSVNDMIGGELKVLCDTKDIPEYSDFDGITARFVFVGKEEG